MQMSWDDFKSWMGKFPQVSPSIKSIRVEGKTEDEARELIIKGTTDFIKRITKENVIGIVEMPRIEKYPVKNKDGSQSWLGYAAINVNPIYKHMINQD